MPPPIVQVPRQWGLIKGLVYYVHNQKILTAQFGCSDIVQTKPLSKLTKWSYDDSSPFEFFKCFLYRTNMTTTIPNCSYGLCARRLRLRLQDCRLLR